MSVRKRKKSKKTKETKETKEILKMSGNELLSLYESGKVSKDLHSFILDHVFLNGCSVTTAKKMVKNLHLLSSLNILSALPEDCIKAILVELISRHEFDLGFRIIKECNLEEKYLKYYINFIIELNRAVNVILGKNKSETILKACESMELYNITLYKDLLVKEIIRIGDKRNIITISDELKKEKEDISPSSDENKNKISNSLKLVNENKSKN